jgi:hypothetical protein
LLATFMEANPNIEVPTVDLTCDEPARTAITMLGEQARVVGIVILEPARTTRTSERVIVPTVEKGIRRMEERRKGKDLHGNLDGLCWLCHKRTICLSYEGTIWFVWWKYYGGCVMKEQFVWFVGNLLIHLVVFWGLIVLLEILLFMYVDEC